MRPWLGRLDIASDAPIQKRGTYICNAPNQGSNAMHRIAVGEYYVITAIFKIARSYYFTSPEHSRDLIASHTILPAPSHCYWGDLVKPKCPSILAIKR